MVPLHGWYSPTRGDNFATTNATWAGAPGVTRSPDYRYSGVQGMVFNPALPQPPGTRPLYSWYSPSRGDNFITTDPAWRGRAGDRRSPDYRFVRLEGYAYATPVAGTVPLQSFWSSGRGDNYATTSAAWTGKKGVARSPGYRMYRDEGYILAVEQTGPEYRAQFGMGTIPKATGTRPVLIILNQYSDVRFRAQHTKQYYERLIFGPRSEGTVAGLVSDMSGGRFRYQKAAILGPNTLANDPRTAVDDSTYNCANNRREKRATCPGATWDWTKTLNRGIEWAGTSGGFNFARYDTNRDGRVTNDELQVIVIAAEPTKTTNPTRYPETYSVDGAVRPLDGGCIRPGGRGVQVCVTPASLGEGVGLATVAHEMMHQVSDVMADIYGSGSTSASLMGSTLYPREDFHPRFHLDPWHKMRLGWANPRIVPMSSEIPGGSALLRVPQGGGATLHEPILFYDPDRGMNEFFLVEFRNPRATGRGRYDNENGGSGVAVWYVKTDGTKKLIQIPKAGGGVGKSAWTIGAPGQRRGQVSNWTERHPETRFNWHGGSRSSLRLRVGGHSASSNDIVIEWRFEGTHLIARIDDVVGSATVTAGSLMRLTGDFGLRDVKVVALVKDGSKFKADITSWSRGRITVRVPPGLARGTYYVHVYKTASYEGPSNPIRIQI